MRKLLFLTATTMLIAFQSYGQTATFEQVGDKEVKGKITEYITESGVAFREGDTIEIGYPFKGDHFVHITHRSSTWSAAMAGTEVPPLTTTSSGHIGVIKNMKATQRKLYVTTYAQGESVGFNIINFEEAFNTGEIILPGYMTSEEALKQLKNEKDKYDLGLITEEEYNTKKKELSKYIK